MAKGCTQEEIDKKIKEHSAEVKFLTDYLKARGCPLPKVTCECCKEQNGRVPGAFYNTRTRNITICSNGPDRGTDYLMDYITHEYIHAIDHCDGADFSQCSHRICSEIRAYILMNPDKNTKWQIKMRVQASMPKKCLKDYNKLFENLYEVCKNSTR
jgi:hypothetical protein